MGNVKDSFIQEWIELSERFGDNPNGPRVLPIEKIGETYYFRDDRLRQLRNVGDASDQLQFETDGDLLVFVMQHRSATPTPCGGIVRWDYGTDVCSVCGNRCYENR